MALPAQPVPSCPPSSAYRFTAAPELRMAVTPHGLDERPVHRWGWLAHSFGPELVDWALRRVGVPERGVVLDAFCGAGSALVAARARGLTALGTDLSPWSLLLSRLKAAAPGRLEPEALRDAASRVEAPSRRRGGVGAPFAAPDDVALARMLAPAVRAEALRIAGTATSGADGPDGALVADALLVALLGALPEHALLVRKGGWLAWAGDAGSAEGVRHDAAALRRSVAERLRAMAGDLDGGLFGADPATGAGGPAAAVLRADARELPLADRSVDLVVTSPPYANRHDYTRAYALELAFLVEERELRRFRAAHFESHPEARPPGRWREAGAFVPKSALDAAAEVERRAVGAGDRSTLRYRVPRMLRGYGADAAVCASELARVVRPGGAVALVVGNSSYAGVEYAADLVWAEALEAAGLVVEEVAVARERAPSPQQTLRGASLRRRESVVVARRDGASVREHGAPGSKARRIAGTASWMRSQDALIPH